MTAKPCSQCKNWDDCSGKPWYSISEIRYCRHQVLWIIKNLVVCAAGEIFAVHVWPSEETGYTDAPQTSHSINAHAPFEKVLQVVGDVTKRLKKTGKDGRLLVLEVQNNSDLSKDARNALNYVSGWREKPSGYPKWLRNRRWYQNKKAVRLRQK